MMESRQDFIENLKEANTHLMILKEDIKYPLTPEKQELLDAAYICTGHLLRIEMNKDLEEAIKELGKQQKKESV